MSLLNDYSTMMSQKGLSTTNKYLEKKRIRSKIINELNYKLKFFKRNFGAKSNEKYLEGIIMGDDNDLYDPP